RLDAEGIRRAVTANSENRPTNTVQQMLDAYIAGFAPPLTEQDEEQLAATQRVVDWLPSSYPGLPAAAELRAAIDRARLLQSFKYLSGTHFRGRVAELNTLREYVGVLPPGSL